MLVGAVILLSIGGVMSGGEQQSHTEGLDYSDYAVGIAFVTAVLILAMTVFGTASAASSGKAFAIFYVLFWLSIGFLIVDAIYLGCFGQAWNSDAESDIITLQNNDGTQLSVLNLTGGNMSVLGAHVEAYYDLDRSQYESWPAKKIVTRDDDYRVILRLNNTAYWNESQQNLTDVTARLKGYGIPNEDETAYREITGWMSPESEPGNLDYGEEYYLVFSDIDQMADESMPAYYLFQVLNNDSTVLGQGYIHPRIEMDELAWFMNLKPN